MASTKSATAVLSILSTIWLWAAPAEGKLLRGYVSEDQELAETRELNNKPVTGAVRADSLPTTYEGTWQCLTVVTDSAVSAVSPGQNLVSDVDFVRTADGRVVARWRQAGWTETQSSILTWSATEGQVDRTSYFYGEGMNGAWAARARDRFTQVGADKILAQSYVDQYIDGRYLGRYRTKSVLVRTSGAGDLAMNK